MNVRNLTFGFAAAALLVAAPIFAQEGQGQALLTVLPHGKDATATLTQQDISLKINGKEANITRLKTLRDPGDRLEVIVMLDSGARTSIGTQLSDIADFIKSLPPNAKAGVAYMDLGVAKMAGPLTTDHAAAAKGLHLPIGISGEDASPYFCLSDLAKHWPSNDTGARREVVMISDGIDYYEPHFDPEDPYMEASITDSVRAGVVVYSIFWENKGFMDRTMYGNDSGQNLLMEVTQATGGNSYWEGLGNPVSFQPYFKDLLRRFQNQYELTFTAPLKNKPQVADMKLTSKGVPGKVVSPQQVYVGRIPE